MQFQKSLFTQKIETHKISADKTKKMIDFCKLKYYENLPSLRCQFIEPHKNRIMALNPFEPSDIRIRQELEPGIVFLTL